MESFLEEEIAIGAEVEIGAPADDSGALRPKRKSKILKKAEKQVFIEKLRAATSPCDEAVGIVIKKDFLEYATKGASSIVCCFSRVSRLICKCF